jgi:hypothetical protein
VHPLGDRFERIVADAKVAELNGKGLPAGDVYKMIKALAAKHEKTSKTFWTQ